VAASLCSTSSPARRISNSISARFKWKRLRKNFPVVAATVFLFDPATHHFFPTCQFHRLTGLNCPGCGMTRALYALLHGDLPTALRDNAFFILTLVALAMRGVWLGLKQLRRRPTGEFFPLKFLWLVLVVALVFTVLRNLPEFAFLSP
jgi:hypothetical protein